jgi:hypothetical protein
MNNVAEKKDVKQVIIAATGAPGQKVLGNRWVSHRLSGEVVSVATDEKTGITTVTITAKAYDERSAQEAYDASLPKDAATTVVPTADADKGKADDMGKEGDMMPPPDMGGE